MTDLPPTDPAPQKALPPSPPAPARTGRGLKIALAISVALNLAVAGLAAGAWLRDGRDRGLPRDLSFGPFSEALSGADKRALRRALIERAPDLRNARAEARADLEAVLGALRAQPYDQAALSAALAKVEERFAGRLSLGRTLLETRFQEMSDQDRQAFADRLERGLMGRP